jgi:hypothetical protein
LFDRDVFAPVHYEVHYVIEALIAVRGGKVGGFLGHCGIGA